MDVIKTVMHKYGRIKDLDYTEPKPPLFFSKLIHTAAKELIENACKFSEKGTPIRVRIFEDSAGRSIRISNHTAHTTAAALNKYRLFEQHHREVAEQQGLGIGLAGDFYGRLEIIGHFLAGSQRRRIVGREAEIVDEALAQGPPEVALEHREPPVGGGGAGLGVAFGEVGVDVAFAGLGQCRAACGQPLPEKLEVAPVGVERVAREAFLQPERIDEGPGAGLAGRCQGFVHQSSLSFCLATTVL